MSTTDTGVEDVLERARRRTGLTELDSESFREGLEIVLAEAARPEVTETGRRLLLKRAVDALANRLRVADYVRSHPAVRDEVVEKPLFVLGLPRTGTTMASFLLDRDPARRSLLNWEAVETVPPATTSTLRTDPRCVRLKQEQQGILEFLRSSDLGVPHWEFADEPTECMFVHEADFKALVWDAWTPSDRYATWLMHEADLTSAYEYEKLVLQVLQSRAPGSWTLKMPSHAVHIEALLQVFPDARLVWAHRDPFVATASLCNLQLTPAQLILGEDGVDRAAIGQGVKEQVREHVARPLAARARLGGDAFFDLHYAALTADPIAEMRRLYAWAGRTWTEELEQGMRSWLADNPQHKYGRPAYSLEQYGLTRGELEPVFADYLDAIPVAVETPRGGTR